MPAPQASALPPNSQNPEPTSCVMICHVSSFKCELCMPTEEQAFYMVGNGNIIPILTHLLKNKSANEYLTQSYAATEKQQQRKQEQEYFCD